MHQLTEAVLKQCTPALAASDSPFLRVHPNVLDVMKKDGIDVEEIRRVEQKKKPVVRAGQDPDVARIERKETIVKIAVGPLVKHYEKVVGKEQADKEKAAVKADATPKVDVGDGKASSRKG